MAAITRPPAEAPLRLAVTGMDCASCALKIETALRHLPGVREVQVSVAAGRVTVRSDGSVLSEAEVTRVIDGLGYRSQVEGATSEQVGPTDGSPSRDRLPVSTVATRWWCTERGGLVAATGVLLAVALAADWLVPVLGAWPFVAATLIGLVPVARRAIVAARAGVVFTIEMLMTIAAVGALAIGAAEEAAVVVFLFALGELLERVAAARARSSISALADLAPKTARVIENGAAREVPAASLVPGQLVLARPGDRIPADGRITDGQSSVDEAPVTGESVPRAKAVGDSVFAGTINVDGALTIRVERAGADNTIARIVRLVAEAQEAKAPTERFIDRFSRWYMPAVVAAALLTALVPPLAFGAEWGTWIYRALALLLIACPCALVISTPAAIAAGLAAGARRGLLMKGGVVLENLARIRTVALDKTGTLTRGRPQLTDIVAADGDRQRALTLAASLEQGSSHPIGIAILAAAKAHSLTLSPVRNGKAVPGRGIVGDVDGRAFRLSRLSEAGTFMTADLQSEAGRLEDAGKTVSVLLEGDQVLALLAVRDEPREDAVAGLRALDRLGIRTVMLTGDSKAVADAVSSSLMIEAWSELMPEDKARIVGELARAGPIAKVGDGINDAPALAAATVGIAMGSGTDVALETADAALLKNDVGGIAELVRLARATLANIHQNVAVALGLKAIFLATTIAGITGLWPAILADTGATVVVTLNALRLLRFDFGRT